MSSTAIARHGFDSQAIEVIKETVAKGATNAQLFMFLELAARYGLDPFAKEIWCVNMGGGMTIMASRDGYLKAAQRDPHYQGLKSFVVREGDEFSIESASDEVVHKFGVKRGAILGAWAIALHANRLPVIVWAEFNEYNKGNSVWKQYPSAMIQKVAEVMALKRQFGINGLVSQEEIDGAHGLMSVESNVIHPSGISNAQRKRLFAIAKDHGVSEAEVRQVMIDDFGIDSTAELSLAQYELLCEELIPQRSRGWMGAEPIDVEMETAVQEAIPITAPSFVEANQ